MNYEVKENSLERLPCFVYKFVSLETTRDPRKADGTISLFSVDNSAPFRKLARDQRGHVETIRQPLRGGEIGGRSEKRKRKNEKRRQRRGKVVFVEWFRL